MPLDAGPVKLGQTDDELSQEDIQNRLQYLADHLADLQSLVGLSAGSTLNGLLALAQSEACLQVKRIDCERR